MSNKTLELTNNKMFEEELLYCLKGILIPYAASAADPWPFGLAP